MALALAHPQQGSFRIAADCGLHQVIQGLQKPGLCLGRWLAATPLSANPRAEHHRARTQVCQAAINRTARNPVVFDTAATPPCPAARSSLAANNRRSLSSRIGSSASKRALMAAVSITPSG